ncbi:MAG: hypothetical protein IT572_05085 [Deltaproteobacteria bacterium]|nr:hypothetical protein [Deltaproteobacteria bacterium]
MKKFFSILALLAVPNFTAVAKEKGPATVAAAPGDLRASGQGTLIFLDEGRRLAWPAQGSLLLQDARGQVLAQVDLRAQASRQSGAEAMGLTVEETDLGGSLSGKKKYLSGKKAPTGRRLGALPDAGLPAEAGTTTQSAVMGVPITTVAYPNGASLWRFEWPGFTEEIFFDKKKSLVHNRQTRKLGGTTVTLQQYADGSFLRHYRQSGGEFGVTFDANDRSYRLVFANAQGETVSEWNCEETCAQENL